MKTHLFTHLITRTTIHKGNYGRLILLLILFLWAILIFSRGYQTLGALVIFFILFVILRVPYLVPVSALVAVVVLFHIPIVNTWTALVESNRTVLENPKQALTNLFTPASGMAGLPAQATEAMSLMQTYHVDRYQLSNQILQNASVTQRITEVSWPRRIDQSSPYIIIFLHEEKDYPGCTVIDQQKEIALEYCG